VTRGLAVFALVAIGLLGAVQACGTPRVEPDTRSLAAGQATSVRRTAAAEVQRIIANPRPATPTPVATPLARPACDGAIWWHEARSHVGESRRVQGAVVGARALIDGTMLLEIGQPYPDPTGMAAVMPSDLASALYGKTVCIAGRISVAEGRPTLRVGDLSAIVAVN
jgi:hypothetical protein